MIYFNEPEPAPLHVYSADFTEALNAFCKNKGYDLTFNGKISSELIILSMPIGSVERRSDDKTKILKNILVF